jgi:hypothetical protein
MWVTTGRAPKGTWIICAGPRLRVVDGLKTWQTDTRGERIAAHNSLWWNLTGANRLRFHYHLQGKKGVGTEIQFTL